jgi:hypothetical protein
MLMIIRSTWPQGPQEGPGLLRIRWPTRIALISGTWNTTQLLPATSKSILASLVELAETVRSTYYTVRLSDVDGFWAGDFIHDSDGNLYLSSGNQIPASIYRVSGGTVSRIYTSNNAPITGMAYRDGSIYYANWGNEIHRLELSTLVDTVVRSQPGHTWISDVGLSSFGAATGVLADASGIRNSGIVPNGIGKIGMSKNPINQLNPQPEPPKPKYY